MTDKKTPFVRVNDLSVSFSNQNGGLQVLDQISLDVQESEFVCIVGPSGSGKSTLLRIISGLLPASAGSVALGGELVTAPQAGVGIVFQDANLMPWRTVLQNVSLPLEVKGYQNGNNWSDETAADLIKLVGLQGFEDSLPRDLSGGMAQRVAIARALVHDPDLLLLDEPFGALDAITRERMGEELLRIWRTHRKTVIMVTHDISEALFLADRVVVLSERPASIKLDLEVSLPRPRPDEIRYTPQFGKLALQLRRSIS